METKAKLCIHIVDDKKETLISLRELLLYADEVETVKIFTNGIDFIDFLTSNADALPDVVLMDIEMPDINGIDTISLTKIKFPDLKFLVLTSFDDESLIFDAIQAGAGGYLLKDEKISVIIDHIKNLVQDIGVPLSPSVAQKAIQLLSKASYNSKTDQHDFRLSEREKEVLICVVDGLDYKETADKLYVSSNTIKKHIQKIYSKLHVSNKAQAIKVANKYDLI